MGALLLLTPGGQALVGFIGGTLAPGAAGASFPIAGASISGAQVVSGGVIGSITGGFNAAIHGGNLGDVLQGAAIGGVQGALAGALHGLEPASFGFNSESALHVAGHGIVGGASNAAMGGKFQDGFISAAVSAAASNAGAFRRIQGPGAGAVASRTALAGVIGGTASALGGGKFSNGAWTSSFQHLLNAEMSDPNGGWSDAPPKAIPLLFKML